MTGAICWCARGERKEEEEEAFLLPLPPSAHRRDRGQEASLGGVMFLVGGLPGVSGRHFCGPLGPFGDVSGASWGLLGCSPAVSEAPWGLLGPLAGLLERLGASRTLLGVFWELFEASWGLLEASWGYLGGRLGASWGSLGGLLGFRGAS